MTDMTSKTVVVTGASSGIGAAAARQLAALGATVVPVGRSVEKTKALADELGVTGLTADFERLDDVRRLAADLAQLPRIDVLINNAGGTWPKAQITADGHERTFQVNHLAPYLLTRLLREPLVATKSRIITTASAAHRGARLDEAGLPAADTAQGFSGMRNYSISKLANILFAGELQRRWGAEGIVATSAHPGVIGSGFGRDSTLVKWFYALGRPFLAGPDKGAQVLVWLASTDQDVVPGGYYAGTAPAATSATARNRDLSRACWEMSAQWVGLPVS